MKKKLLFSLLIALSILSIITSPVSAGLSVNVDIKPHSDPNTLNIEQNGVIPVAILGGDTSETDVTKIDPTTVTLEQISPLRWEWEDVSGDGYLDLTLKYEAEDIIAALSPANDGDTRILHITGRFKPEFNYLPIEGSDLVIIFAK
jgi:hypothetical protein